MKTKIITVFLALLLLFSLISVSSADTAQNGAEPLDHDAAALSEAEARDELLPVEVPEETETPELAEEPEEIEEPKAADASEEAAPVEIPETTEAAEPADVSEESKADEAEDAFEETKAVKAVESSEETEEPEAGESAPVKESVFDGTVTLNPSDVKLSGKTPYVVYNKKAQTPGVIVKDKSGKTVAASEYTVTYRDNTNPGTAYADVTMKDTGAKASVWFKIYLPATASTTVKNVGDGLFEGDPENGIQVSWKKVDGAKGYVIYRRAWNLKSNGWTKFVRWNNTTKTTWIDTKVYPGTRYQYGIKAYFSDPMDNYNLGLVGPLKTMVRITTRQFGPKMGSPKDTVRRTTLRWRASSLFTGYQLQIANDEEFTQNVKTITIDNPKTNEYVIRGMKAGIWYYARVRSYHVIDGATYYGAWSFSSGHAWNLAR